MSRKCKRAGRTAQHLRLARSARPLRFALTGGLSGFLQLGLLALLTGRGWPATAAKVVAVLLAAQVTFSVSCLFPW